MHRKSVYILKTQSIAKYTEDIKTSDSKILKMKYNAPHNTHMLYIIAKRNAWTQSVRRNSG